MYAAPLVGIQQDTSCDTVLHDDEGALTVQPIICCKDGTFDLRTGMILSNSTEYEEDAKKRATVGSADELLMLAAQAWLVSSIAK